jgi:hypothetical protein
MDPVQSILSLVATPQNAAVAFGVAVLITSARKAFPQVFERPSVARALPLIGVPLCIGAMWIPGLVVAEGVGHGDRIMLGLIISWGVSWAHKALMQSVLGK